MSAFEIIGQIRELPADQQPRVAKFIAANGGSITRRHLLSLGTESDGLPVIRAKGEAITAHLVRQIENRAP